MGDKLATSRRAVAQFLKAMNPQDETFLIEFNDQPALAVEFTSDVEEIEDKLTYLQAQSPTAMLDAVNMDLHEMRKAKNPPQGHPNYFRWGRQSQPLHFRRDSVSRARGGRADLCDGRFPSHSIFVGMTPGVISGPRLLAELAQQTGGRAFSATISNDLPSVAARIGIELRNQYVLAYSPKNQERNGNYRHVEVKISQPRGLPLFKAHWRLGYYAPIQ